MKCIGLPMSGNAAGIRKGPLAILCLAVTIISVTCVTGGGGTGNGSQYFPLLFSEDFEQGSEGWTATDPSAWKVAEENGNDDVGNIDNVRVWGPRARAQRERTRCRTGTEDNRHERAMVFAPKADLKVVRVLGYNRASGAEEITLLQLIR